MQAVKDEIETIHLYVVREEEKKPHSSVPLFLAFCSLLAIVAVTVYSAQHPYYEHERLTIPAQYLPLKVFKAEAPIIPTGIKTYPATYAHGYLTFSNGSIIGQSVPAGFTIDGVVTDRATYVPPATANGFGVSTVSAHLLAPGTNLSTLSINEVIGPSLFIRNLSPFTGGHPAYTMRFVTDQDRLEGVRRARNLLTLQKAQIGAFLAKPCNESTFVLKARVRLSSGCLFAIYKVPSYMHVQAARLSGKNFVVDVWFVPPLRPMPFR